MKYCVYEHYYKGKLIYVGSGTLKRSYRKTFRNEKYKELCEGNNKDITIKIEKYFDNRDEAYQYEEGLIHYYFIEGINLSNILIGRSAYGKANGFYGKQHNEKTKAIIGYKTKKWIEENREQFDKNMKTSRNKNWKRKISISKTGVKLSPEHRAAISNGTSGEKNPMYGKTHTKKAMKSMVKNRKDFAKIAVENVLTKEIKKFESANEAARAFDLKPYMITRKTKDNNIYKINNLKVWRENNDLF